MMAAMLSSLKNPFGAVLLCVLVALAAAVQAAGEPVDIGSQRELFLDRHIIGSLHGASLRLHEPVSAGTALTFDRPHEGVFCGYITVIKDGDKYRMYYRGLPASRGGEADHSLATEVTCYAESRDGIAWTRPSLGLHEVQGGKDNNVILVRSPACHNFSPFLDTRDGVDPRQRFKAVGGNAKVGLIAFVSADGIHFSKLCDEPIIRGGAFDSQNLVFWSTAEDCYVCYFRTMKRVGAESYRWVSRTTSRDFLNWTEPVEMDMGETPPVHFYTNQTQPYYRAPQIYVSFFARFIPGRQVLTKEQVARLGVVGDYFHDVSDACLMSSRGSDRYDRTFQESFVRPGRGPANWTSRTNYPALGIVPTADGMMSMFIQRNYATPSHRLERLTLRPDGFASVQAGFEPGEMITRPLSFSGRSLNINVSTSAAGELRAEMQDADGTPIPGYTLDDCVTVVGDEIDLAVKWKDRTDVAALAGKPVRVRFVMKEADLYAVQFR